MPTKNVTLHWNTASKFTAKNKDNVEIPLNQLNAMSASDLLPVSLIGCSSVDVVEILGKQKQDLRELKVSAEATQDNDPPWRFRKIHIHYQVIGTGIDVEKVQKAVKLSEEKYCSVYATLRDAIEITHDIEVLEG